MQLPQIKHNSTTNKYEDYANKVLSHFKINYPDEIDLYELCWRYGIKIKPLAPDYCPYEVDKSIKAFSISTGMNRRGLIYLDPDLDSIAKKICLAEEFCHLYLHHNNQLIKSIYEINKTEKQAKKMSAYLLMPSRFIKDVYNAAYEQPVMVSEIADYFLVTEEFAHYRLELMYSHHVEAILKFKGKLGTIGYF